MAVCILHNYVAVLLVISHAVECGKSVSECVFLKNASAFSRGVCTRMGCLQSAAACFKSALLHDFSPDTYNHLHVLRRGSMAFCFIVRNPEAESRSDFFVIEALTTKRTKTKRAPTSLMVLMAMKSRMD